MQGGPGEESPCPAPFFRNSLGLRPALRWPDYRGAGRSGQSPAAAIGEVIFPSRREGRDRQKGSNLPFIRK